MPTGFFIWGYMYPFTFIFGGTSKFLGVQSLTLHLGVQRNQTLVNSNNQDYAKVDKSKGEDFLFVNQQMNYAREMTECGKS
jgi:hypothetical protein